MTRWSRTFLGNALVAAGLCSDVLSEGSSRMTTNNYRSGIVITDGPSAGELWDAGKYAISHRFEVAFKGYFSVASSDKLYTRDIVIYARVLSVGYENKKTPSDNLIIEVGSIQYGGGHIPSWLWQQPFASIIFDAKRRRGSLTVS